MALKNLPKICPSCGKRLSVQAMHCNGCDTHIEGDYNLPVMMQLSAPDQQFVLDFVKSSGSLKEMAQKLGLSYPTVRNRLDDIIAQLNQFEGDEQDSDGTFGNYYFRCTICGRLTNSMDTPADAL